MPTTLARKKNWVALILKKPRKYLNILGLSNYAQIPYSGPTHV
jgi:hypothetical protein